MDGKDKKSDAKLSEEADIEKLLMKYYNFLPSELNEIYDIIENCDEMINFHMESTAGFSDMTKQKVTSLSLKQNDIQLKLNELYLVANEFLKKVKLNKYFDTKIDVNQKEVDDFNKKLAEIKAEAKSLLGGIREYLVLVQEQRPF